MEFKKIDTPVTLDQKIEPTKKKNIFGKILLFIIVFLVAGIVTFLIIKGVSNTNRDDENQSNNEKVVEKTQEDIYLEKLRAALDIENETTRNYAVKLASKYPGNYNIDQVCKIYEYLYQNWKYVNDPRGFEFFSSASNSINADLSGDCDDFAIIMSALIEDISGKTRISLATNYNGSGHAYTEVYFADDPQTIKESINKHYQGFFESLFGISKVKTIHYKKDNDGGIWVNLDWSSKFPGGEYYKSDELTIYYPLENRYVKVK